MECIRITVKIIILLTVILGISNKNNHEFTLGAHIIYAGENIATNASL